MANINQAKPTWNLYDVTENPEHDLYNNYIMEYTDIAGILVDYYIRDESIEMDDLYGESTRTSYKLTGRTKVVYEPTEEITMTNSFGITSEEMIQYAEIPKSTFTRDVSGGYNPKAGDVVKILWNNRQYEIVDVHEETRIFQLKKLVWEFILKPYRYAEESDEAKEILKSPDSTLVSPVTAYGENDWLEDESDDIEDYDDTDKSFYGF